MYIYKCVCMCVWRERERNRMRGSSVTLLWWRYEMETSSALLAPCVGNSPVTGEFPSQMPVTQIFDVFCHLCLNKRLSKQSRGRWLMTPSRSLWRHCNDSCDHRLKFRRTIIYRQSYAMLFLQPMSEYSLGWRSIKLVVSWWKVSTTGAVGEMIQDAFCFQTKAAPEAFTLPVPNSKYAGK